MQLVRRGKLASGGFPALLDRHQLERRGEWLVSWVWVGIVGMGGWNPLVLSFLALWPWQAGNSAVWIIKGRPLHFRPCTGDCQEMKTQHHGWRPKNLIELPKTTFGKYFRPERAIILHDLCHFSCQPRETVVSLDIPLGAMQVKILCRMLYCMLGQLIWHITWTNTDKMLSELVWWNFETQWNTEKRSSRFSLLTSQWLDVLGLARLHLDSLAIRSSPRWWDWKLLLFKTIW